MLELQAEGCLSHERQQRIATLQQMVARERREREGQSGCKTEFERHGSRVSSLILTVSHGRSRTQIASVYATLLAASRHRFRCFANKPSTTAAGRRNEVRSKARIARAKSMRPRCSQVEEAECPGSAKAPFPRRGSPSARRSTESAASASARAMAAASPSSSPDGRGKPELSCTSSQAGGIAIQRRTCGGPRGSESSFWTADGKTTRSNRLGRRSMYPIRIK